MVKYAKKLNFRLTHKRKFNFLGYFTINVFMVKYPKKLNIRMMYKRKFNFSAYFTINFFLGYFTINVWIRVRAAARTPAGDKSARPFQGLQGVLDLSTDLLYRPPPPFHPPTSTRPYRRPDLRWTFDAQDASSKTIKNPRLFTGYGIR